MKKKILINFIIIVASMLLFSPLAIAASYDDISGHWAEDAINTWSNYGIIEGDNGSFRPNDSITRSEMAAIIDRIVRYQSQASNSFSDLNSSKWYYSYILKLNAADVIRGYGDNTVRPQNNITKQEAACMIYRALGMDILETTPCEPFGDADQISDWALEAVDNLHNLEYINGYQGNFSPLSSITRAETVTIIDNIIKKLWRYNGLECNDIDGSVFLNSDRHFILNSHFTGNVFIGPDADRVVLKGCIIEGKVIELGNTNVTIMSEDKGENIDDEIYGFFYSNDTLFILDDVEENLYNAKYFQHSGSRSTYNEAGIETKNGIDVSEWQTIKDYNGDIIQHINWQKVAADNVDFAIIRLGWRGYDPGLIRNLDDAYEHNIVEAINNGLDVGVYFFSQAITVEEAIAEAEFCLENLEGHDITYPVVFDWEPFEITDSRTKNMNGTLLTDCAIAFCQTIEADEAGYTAMVYSNKSMALYKLELERLTDYDFWLAGYTSYPEFYYGFDMWQYTSSGSVNGISGNVDMNIHFLD